MWYHVLSTLFNLLVENNTAGMKMDFLHALTYVCIFLLQQKK